MKITIISDIHGNFDALAALPDDYDELWVLGDLVNYGPQPAEVIDYVRSRAAQVVQGDHDYCVGFDVSLRCPPNLQKTAEGARDYTKSILSEGDRKYLRELPLQAEVFALKKHFWLCHATPSQPLFPDCLRDSELWPHECKRVQADILLVGHTHIPFKRQIGTTLLLNPGSLGQANLDGEYNYAVLVDGKASFRSFPIESERTVRKIREMLLPTGMQNHLIEILLKGALYFNERID